MHPSSNVQYIPLAVAECTPTRSTADSVFSQQFWSGEPKRVGGVEVVIGGGSVAGWVAWERRTVGVCRVSMIVIAFAANPSLKHSTPARIVSDDP